MTRTDIYIAIICLIGIILLWADMKETRAELVKVQTERDVAIYNAEVRFNSCYSSAKDPVIRQIYFRK